MRRRRRRVGSSRLPEVQLGRGTQAHGAGVFSLPGGRSHLSASRDAVTLARAHAGVIACVRRILRYTQGSSDATGQRMRSTMGVKGVVRGRVPKTPAESPARRDATKASATSGGE